LFFLRSSYFETLLEIENEIVVYYIFISDTYNSNNFSCFANS